MTKAELEIRVAELEKQLSEAPSIEHLQEKIESMKKTDSKRVQELYDNNRKVKELEAEKATKEAQHSLLTARFNDLAKLFDEYIKVTDDNFKTNQLFIRTIQRSKELMEIKIKAFNGEGDKK